MTDPQTMDEIDATRVREQANVPPWDASMSDPTPTSRVIDWMRRRVGSGWSMRSAEAVRSSEGLRAAVDPERLAAAMRDHCHDSADEGVPILLRHKHLGPFVRDDCAIAIAAALNASESPSDYGIDPIRDDFEAGMDAAYQSATNQSQISTGDASESVQPPGEPRR